MMAENVESDTALPEQDAPFDARSNVSVMERHAHFLRLLDRSVKHGKITADQIRVIKEEVANWALAHAKLEGQYEEIKAENDRLRKEAAKPQKSYAAVAAAPITIKRTVQDTIKQNVQKAVPTVFIKPKKGDDVKTAKAKFEKSINPRVDKIKINQIRTTKNVLIVELASTEDSDKLMNNTKIQESFTCEKPRKRRPLMMMYDVPSYMTQDDVADCVYAQNFEDKMTREEFTEQFKVRFKAGPRDRNTVHHAIEVSPELRKQIITTNRLYVGYNAISVKDYTALAKCTKCHDYGHVAKYCSFLNPVCGNCGSEKHDKTKCDRETPTCIPCKYRKRTCNTPGKECATYKIMIQRLIQRTDYGNAL
ncbi:uncharacterized protein LOC126333369 [Schistocerca gregaria]|uniref:uncharacterized protein LOC126333369 n=1 Tax=Schistocerca gregaria TaxID=7010 RepID=UPI00211ECE16|nr:uncharacterized protein LOC126333369 [Schistocerca gregaria]